MIIPGSSRAQRWNAVYRRIQAEAASRPGARLVPTPYGAVWMSPIEVQLYDSLVRKGLAPVPQGCIEGYFVDFAFPSVHLAVEADGAVHGQVAVQAHDHHRDWILRRAGWTVLRFQGTTIFHRSDNCAFIVDREIRSRLEWMERKSREEQLRRAARRDAMRHPLRTVLSWLSGPRNR